jgi:uncharacterized membrane protein YphA (DoxX/SURF4 family)
MAQISLLLLRISMGGLMLFWGIDKLANVQHSVRVAETFYFGVGTNTALLAAFGVAQSGLDALIVIGLLRRYAYPALTLICATTAFGVWKSIVDPWGWYLEGTNVLFYPSFIILAAALVLWGMMDEDINSLPSKGGSFCDRIPA